MNKQLLIDLYAANEVMEYIQACSKLAVENDNVDLLLQGLKVSIDKLLNYRKQFETASLIKEFPVEGLEVMKNINKFIEIYYEYFPVISQNA